MGIEYKLPAARQADSYGASAAKQPSNDNDDDIRDNVDYGAYED